MNVYSVRERVIWNEHMTEPGSLIYITLPAFLTREQDSTRFRSLGQRSCLAGAPVSSRYSIPFNTCNELAKCGAAKHRLGGSPSFVTLPSSTLYHRTHATGTGYVKRQVLVPVLRSSRCAVTSYVISHPPIDPSAG